MDDAPPKLQHFPPLHQSYSRKEQVLLNRLLIGHTHLTHSYLLNREQPPNCDYCKSPLTAEHILTSCSAYKNIREKHYSNSQLPHILTNISKQHIFNYLSEINIFNKLKFVMARYGLFRVLILRQQFFYQLYNNYGSSHSHQVLLKLSR